MVEITRTQAVLITFRTTNNVYINNSVINIEQHYIHTCVARDLNILDIKLR